jgi:subtilisin family serine protease
MKRSKQFFPALITLLLFSLSAFVQTKTANHKLLNYHIWHLLDYQQDSVYGTSVNRAYNELLKNKKSHPVIVAVIDGGVDITHEDLQGHIWTNKNEIPGNGIDDDKNGYADDMHGWNYLGGKDGRVISATNSDADREYARLLSKYATIQDSVQASDKEEYRYFLRVTKLHQQDSVGRKKAGLLFKEVKDDPFEVRKDIVGDNPFDINDRNYGNNIVGDTLAIHGTHCTGIIAALRNNGIGMDGIADNVLIMSIRAVPMGDEMDKDIALAIRYAVNNGAKIISMSFGKDFSAQKQWVDEAVKYAEKKGVLLVHGSGNNARNSDSVPFYPNPNFAGTSERAKNMITVGASSVDTGYYVPAYFSNYGQNEVDLFAPGMTIYSSIPVNKYEFGSGTSTSTPVVAGIAALILEYYPHLRAEQVKEILMKSVTSLKGKIVIKPGSKEKVDFATLCVSGGIVNAYKALQLAAYMTSKRR